MGEPHGIEDDPPPILIVGWPAKDLSTIEIPLAGRAALRLSPRRVGNLADRSIATIAFRVVGIRPIIRIGQMNIVTAAKIERPDLTAYRQPSPGPGTNAFCPMQTKSDVAQYRPST
jgi:hypothetical protein